MAVSAEKAVQRYKDAMSSTATKAKYIDGINSTTENPMAKAAEQDEHYLAQVERSVRSGRRRQKLLSVPMDRWKHGAIKKGAERLSSGAAAAEDKVRQHFQKWAPIYDEMSTSVKDMPKGTTQAALDRVKKVIEIAKRAAGKEI